MRFVTLARLSLLASTLGAFGPALAQGSYDPLRALGPDGRVEDAVIRDDARDRDIPVRAWIPPGRGPFPTILFSHGLGGARENSPYLGRHWSSRGYLVVFLQHEGSDAATWEGKAPQDAIRDMRSAANARNLVLRAQDVRVVLDAIGAGRYLQGLVDPARIGMTGHSFGAITTQAVSGEAFPLAGARFTDDRIRAALPMSPSAPRRGGARAFSGVRIPWLVMTGTRDNSPIGNATASSRLGVFAALPQDGHAYQLVLDGATHMAFSDRVLRTERGARNPNHHRVILALSTAFWDAYLRDDAAARRWLNGDGPRTVLEPRDRWERK